MLRNSWPLSVLERYVRRPPLLYRSIRLQSRAIDDMGEEERRALQNRLVQSIMDCARSVPFYRDLPQWTKLTDLPILTKVDLLEREQKFKRRTFLPNIAATTSGSTGTPLRIFRSFNSMVREQGILDHLITLAGGEPVNGKVAVLRGDTIKQPNDTEPPFWRVVNKQKVILSAYHLSERTYRHFVTFLESYRPTILMAYPSALQHFLYLAESSGRAIKIPLIVTSSERLPEGIRAQAHRVLGSRLLDYYGQAERVCLAWSIRDGEYWFRPEYGKVELKRKYNDFAVIATGLGNAAQPLVRYDTGDEILVTGSKKESRLSRIELGLEPFFKIVGRESEYIALPNGSRVIGLNHIPRGLKGVVSIQFIQETLDTIRIRVVPGAGYSEASLKDLEKNFWKKVPRLVRVEWDISDHPFRLSSGKAPLYINRLPKKCEIKVNGYSD